MKVVWKYKLEIDDEVIILMPKGTKVLTVQVQDGAPCIWAAVDPNEKKEMRKFRIAGTGHPIDDTTVGGYIGTVQLHDGRLVLHVFEITT